MAITATIRTSVAPFLPDEAEHRRQIANWIRLANAGYQLYVPNSGAPNGTIWQALDQLTGSLSAVFASISALGVSVAANTSAIGQLSLSVSAINSSITNFTSAISDIRVSISTNALAITNLQNSLSATNVTVADHTSAIAAVRSSVSVLNVSVSNLSLSVSAINTSVTNLQLSVSAINTTVASNTSNIAVNVASISANSTLITTLFGSVSVNAVAIANLQNSLSATNVVVADHTSAIARLSLSVSAINTTVTNNVSAIANIRLSVSAINTSVTNNISAIAAVRSSVSALSTTVNNNVSAIAAVRSSVSALSTVVTNHTSAISALYASVSVNAVAIAQRPQEITSYAALRLFTGTASSIFVMGVAAPLDGGAGLFRVDSADVTSSDNGGTIIVDANSRRWKREFIDAVHVKWFGAVGNGTAVDTTAISSALVVFKNVASASSRETRFVFEEGAYVIDDSLDFTNIRSNALTENYWSVEFHGAKLIAKCTGKIAMDFTNSLGGVLDKVCIIGDSTSIPKIGIQLARETTTGSADLIKLNSCKVVGSFTLAPFYNFGSERFEADQCLFRNQYSISAAYAAIIDGRNKFAASSDFRTITVSPDIPVSCLSHFFNQTSFLHDSPLGAAIFETRAHRVRMNACYLATGNTGIQLGLDTFGLQDHYYHLHMEPISGSLLTSNFLFTPESATGTTVTVRGFTWIENSARASASWLTASGLDVNITHGHLEVEALGTQPANGIFSPATRFLYQGTLNLGAVPTTNFGSGMRGFMGDVHVPQYDTATFRFAPGSFRVTEESATDTVMKGTHRFYGTSAQTFTGSELTTRPYIETGAGTLFFGNHPATVLFGAGDTTVTSLTVLTGLSGNSLTVRHTAAGGTATDLLVLNSAGLGGARVPRLAADPGSATGGDVYYNTATNTFRKFIGGGTGWTDWT